MSYIFSAKLQKFGGDAGCQKISTECALATLAIQKGDNWLFDFEHNTRRASFGQFVNLRVSRNSPPAVISQGAQW